MFSTSLTRTLQSGISHIYGIYPSGAGPKMPYVKRNFHIPPYDNNTSHDIDEQNFAFPYGHQLIPVKYNPILMI